MTKILTNNWLCTSPSRPSSIDYRKYLLRYADFQHFEAHLSQKKTAMKNSIKISLLSMFLQELKTSFSRSPSSYAQWEVHSAELEKHLKYIL